MNSKEIKTKIQEEGFIHAIVMFEVVGNPKDFVETALKQHLDKLRIDKDIDVLKEDIERAEKQEAFWSAFAEVEMLVKNLEKFTWLCMNFMPSSVEIMSPETISFKGRELTNWLNDLLAKMHEIGVLSQQLGQQNKLLVKNINAIIRNSILLCIDFGLNTPKQMGVKIGVSEKDLDPVFEAMMKEKTIKKEGKKYLRK